MRGQIALVETNTFERYREEENGFAASVATAARDPYIRASIPAPPVMNRDTVRPLVDGGHANENESKTEIV